MKFTWYKSGIWLLMFTSATLLFMDFWGCTNDPADTEEPFVRLLKNESVHSTIFNRSINYAVLLPENYNTSIDSYPVVYLLHGYGDDYESWYEYGLIQYYSDLSASETVPMIFVMPQGFNSYYVNRHNGNLPYMDFFITELVPEIDSVYRTKKDNVYRAVMGYSMGGYGALILPAMNPDIFSISIPLSMSFRTDEQYLAEPQEVFDSQWGITFGGYGTSGESRLTDYFKEYSPFHFFDQSDLTKYSGLRILMDCGDDEETLSETNSALHNLMQDHLIPHEYRVRNGGHSWDYWHKSLPEALKFISYGFEGLSYPADPEPVNVGDMIASGQYILEHMDGSDLQCGIFKPLSYDTDANPYPVIFFIHDFGVSDRTEHALNILSLLNNAMKSGSIPPSLVIEIPKEANDITAELLSGIIHHVDEHYRIVADKKGRIFMGNEQGGAVVCSLVPDFKDTFNACFLFNAALALKVHAIQDLYYYVDVTDKSEDYRGNHDLYLDLREKGNQHEYRVRQGLPSLQAFLNGLDGSMNYLSQKLKGQ